MRLRRIMQLEEATGNQTECYVRTVDSLRHVSHVQQNCLKLELLLTVYFNRIAFVVVFFLYHCTLLRGDYFFNFVISRVKKRRDSKRGKVPPPFLWKIPGRSNPENNSEIRWNSTRHTYTVPALGRVGCWKGCIQYSRKLTFSK